MADWDEDTPPPLSSLPDQVHAVQLSNSIIGTAGLKEGGELRVAATTPAHAAAAAAATAAGPAKPFKRGFLDAKPQKQGKAGTSSSKQRIQALKPKQQAEQLGKQIPSMFQLPPSEQQQRYDVLKTQLLDALQPTPETIAAVGSDPTLASGFDDSEVMRAVAEVARDPSAIKKYASNPKVQQFYMAFGSLMGTKLESSGQSVSKHASTQPIQQSSSRAARNYLA